MTSFPAKSALQRSPWGEKRRASYNAETQFQRVVTDLATALGWEWWHVNVPMRSREGFPDLVLFRERIVWVELKARSRLTGRMGKLSLEQQRFREIIEAAGGEWHLFTDEDMDEITEVLAKPGQQVKVV